jgi:simple sugar transport system ATP-binding protein
MNLVMASVDAPVRSLSGGNQQRVVLAKWLNRNPRILILNSPTVGVDVGSKHDILDMVRAKAGEGVAILVISDDVPELVAVCHRVLVVREGRIVDVLEGDQLTEDQIVKELLA